MSVDINKIDLSNLTSLDIKIIQDIIQVINDNEVTKDQFKTYSVRILEFT